MGKKKFDFNTDLLQANKIEDLQERLLYLKKRLKEYIQWEPTDLAWEVGNTSKQYKVEIEYVNDLIKSQPQQSTPNSTSTKANKPIQLDLEQRQIIYLFQKLIDEKLLNETKNPSLWDLVSQYFTDKDGTTIKNIHQNKDGLKNTKTGKPKNGAAQIENIVTSTKNSL